MGETLADISDALPLLATLVLIVGGVLGVLWFCWWVTRRD